MTIVNAVPRLLGLLLVITAVILLAGLGLSKTDLLNPATSAARQRQMDEQTRHLKAMNALEEQQIAQQNQIELERRRSRAERDLVQQTNRSRLLTSALVAGTAVLVPGLLLLGTWAALSRFRPGSQPAHSPAATGAELWQDPAYREAMIRLAKTQERLIGEQRFYAQQLHNTRASKDNHRDDLDWPIDLDLDEPVPELDGRKG